MANFQPMKSRLLMLLQENIKLFKIQGRFIDYGCGRGDCSEYLIQQKEFQEGLGFDPSLPDTLQNLPAKRTNGKELNYSNKLKEGIKLFDCAVLFDVIEHIPDPGKALKELRQLVRDNGWLFITVPYNQHEWGFDDEYYGHLRRLSFKGIISMCENNDWMVVRVLDPSFPTFWFIRKIYLLTRRIFNPFTKTQKNVVGSDIDRSLISSRQSAWDTGGWIQKILSGSLLPWQLMRKFDYYYESFYHGFELFVVCQKNTDLNICRICDNGRYSYRRFFKKYALQKCIYCQTEKIISNDISEPPFWAQPNKKKYSSKTLEYLLKWLRTKQFLALKKKHPKCNSIYIVSREPSSVLLLSLLNKETFKINSFKNSADNELSWLFNINEPFSMVILFHIIEHISDIGVLFDNLNKLVKLGGTLVLEFPNSRSLLKNIFHWRWFGYDPPNHLYVIDPLFLSDQLGLKNYRLVKEQHFSIEYSFFIFAQTLLNTLMPFQRDCVYRFLKGEKTSLAEKFLAIGSLPLLLILLIPFLLYQPIVSFLRMGCVVRQTYCRIDAPTLD
jgi:2-polyprenyl-3-methyl-5-hydroxy-6-metoxy-1,4-benzoquinol methylase